MPRSWYSIQMKDESQDSAEISIYGAIGATWDGDGVTAKQFIADLKGIKAKNITLYVNSPGGQVMDGIAINNALSMHGAQITARVMGIAASAASFVIMAAHKIEMPRNTFLMIHKAASLSWGNSDEMRKTADILDKIDTVIADIYARRSGKSEDDIKAMLADETWMTAEEAVEQGFADEVTDAIEATAEFDLGTLPANIQAAFKNAPQPTAPTPEAKTDAPALAEQVKAAFEEASLGDYAAHFALSLDKIEAVEPAIAQVREVVALCATAKRPEAAGEFIKAGKSVADVRAALLATLADEDDAASVDTAPSKTPTNRGASAGLKTADVWAARRRKTN